ncbi:uncharacterized protein KD926_008701 [Aspergillus affinis]|uniref:uncharacterized protein n=1 Tax=Aspergillus affinis TaxID=1070780 RepID=UPI0022FE636B|nr:uncharacterized protein KD926_008701 [Aspergillus affinis]KAI9040010.1 hypothetical protein KD926_008701 [Aspergillus affinis]
MSEQWSQGDDKSTTLADFFSSVSDDMVEFTPLYFVVDGSIPIPIPIPTPSPLSSVFQPTLFRPDSGLRSRMNKPVDTMTVKSQGSRPIFRAPDYSRTQTWSSTDSPHRVALFQHPAHLSSSLGDPVPSTAGNHPEAALLRLALKALRFRSRGPHR